MVSRSIGKRPADVPARLGGVRCFGAARPSPRGPPPRLRARPLPYRVGWLGSSARICALLRVCSVSLHRCGSERAANDVDRGMRPPSPRGWGEGPGVRKEPRRAPPSIARTASPCPWRQSPNCAISASSAALLQPGLGEVGRGEAAGVGGAAVLDQLAQRAAVRLRQAIRGRDGDRRAVEEAGAQLSPGDHRLHLQPLRPPRARALVRPGRLARGAEQLAPFRDAHAALGCVAGRAAAAALAQVVEADLRLRRARPARARSSPSGAR